MPIPASCAGQTYICMVQLDLDEISKSFLYCKLHKMACLHYQLIITFEQLCTHTNGERPSQVEWW